MTFDNQSSFAGNEASTGADNEEVKVAEGPADAVKLDDIFDLAEVLGDKKPKKEETTSLQKMFECRVQNLVEFVDKKKQV